MKKSKTQNSNLFMSLLLPKTNRALGEKFQRGEMMSTKKESPEEMRERMRQEELKNNPTGSLNEGFNRGRSPNLSDMSWKETGVLILILIVGYIVFSLFF